MLLVVCIHEVMYMTVCTESQGKLAPITVLLPSSGGLWALAGGFTTIFQHLPAAPVANSDAPSATVGLTTQPLKKTVMAASLKDRASNIQSQPQQNSLLFTRYQTRNHIYACMNSGLQLSPVGQKSRLFAKTFAKTGMNVARSFGLQQCLTQEAGRIWITQGIDVLPQAVPQYPQHPSIAAIGQLMSSNPTAN